MDVKPSILITGATGFVGRHLIAALSGNYPLHLAIRGMDRAGFEKSLPVFTGLSLLPETNWQEALKDCNTVIHTAARVHVMKEKAANPLQEFRTVNVEGTLHLARQAASGGIKRFIFLSTAKVNGEFTTGKPFAATDVPNPTDPYAVSKFEAEQGLLQLARETGMEVVIIRPPLVYGAEVKGNFLTMVRILQKGLPLPLGAIHNKRSLVAIENLISLIETCLVHKNAANRIFLVSDGADLSTTELLRALCNSMNKSAFLIPVSTKLLSFFASLLGKKAVFSRLCGSLQLDISQTCKQLNWQPKADTIESFRLAVQGFKKPGA
ncbi:MAG: SDR family oxidoreductase [Tatlockia sp.]